MSQSTDRAVSGQYLTFMVGAEEYGVPLASVREIVGFGLVTHVPGTPPWIRGVMNLRGGVMAVVDAAVKFGLPPSQPTKLTCVVVFDLLLDGETVAMGVMVDLVKDVVELGPDSVEPPPPFGTRVRVEYVVGMAKIADRLAVLLDVQGALSAEELLAVVAVGEAAAPEPWAAEDHAAG